MLELIRHHGVWTWWSDDGDLLPVMAGGKGGSPPPPSAEERRLQGIQAESAELNLQLTRQQIAREEEYEPFLLQYYGLQRDDAGTLTRIDEEAFNTRQEIEKKSNARVLAALEGNLPVDPSVEQDIERGMAQVKEELSRRLGPGAEGGDVWNRGIAEANRQFSALRYDVRRGELSSADAIYMNRSADLIRRQSAVAGSMRGGAVNSANMLAGVSGTAEAALDPLRRNREYAANWQMQSQRGAGAMRGAAISGGTSVAGATAIALAI